MWATELESHAAIEMGPVPTAGRCCLGYWLERLGPGELGAQLVIEDYTNMRGQ